MIPRRVLVLTATLAVGACSPVYRTHAPGSMPAALDPPRERTSSRARVRPEVGNALAAILGELVWPLAIDRATVLSSPYGSRAHSASGSTRFHSGLDLRASSGTPIYAAADGRVVRSGIGGAYGNVVIIDHGSELHSLYGHNERNVAREGEHVRRGQVIAFVGHTGNATGDHLHFELRWRGGTVDPAVVLPRLSSRSAR